MLCIVQVQALREEAARAAALKASKKAAKKEGKVAKKEAKAAKKARKRGSPEPPQLLPSPPLKRQRTSRYILCQSSTSFVVRGIVNPVPGNIICSGPYSNSCRPAAIQDSS